jgi:hypothetical protein
MKDDSLGCPYLHPNFWYHGMNKIKAGKGYRNDIPLGPIGGKCSECDGDIISIKMNTSAKGFETTSEKVCNKCGLIVPGAFQTLEPKGEYKARYYATHDEWVEAMKPKEPEDDDIAWDNELFEHFTGRRPGDDEEYEISYIAQKSQTFEEYIDKKDSLDYHLGLKSKWKLGVRAEDWNRGTKERMQHKLKQQYNYLDICKTQLGMNNNQVDSVRYIINTKGVKEFHRQTSYEDIIAHICLVVMSYSMKPQRFSVLVREYKRYNTYNRVLYQRIKDMLV